MPKDVRHIIGQSEFKRPLHGATLAEINRLHREALVEWEARIAAARAHLRGELRSLTLREIHEVCGGWYRAEAEAFAEEPHDEEAWEPLLDEIRDGDDEPFTPRALDEMRRLLAARGIAADEGSVRRTAVALRETKLKFYGLMIRRCRGDWGEDLNLAAFPTGPAREAAETARPDPRSPAPLTFASLVEAWAAETRPPQKSREKWNATFRNLAATIGHNDARRVTVDDVRKWKAARLAAGGGRAVGRRPEPLRVSALPGFHP